MNESAIALHLSISTNKKLALMASLFVAAFVAMSIGCGGGEDQNEVISGYPELTPAQKADEGYPTANKLDEDY